MPFVPNQARRRDGFAVVPPWSAAASRGHDEAEPTGRTPPRMSSRARVLLVAGVHGVGCSPSARRGVPCLTFDNSAQDIPERELTLSSPITHRSAGSTRENVLENVGTVSVSAAKIAFLTVGYVGGDTDAADERQLRRLREQTSESTATDRRPDEWEPPRRGLRRIFSGW